MIKITGFTEIWKLLFNDFKVWGSTKSKIKLVIIIMEKLYKTFIFFSLIITIGGWIISDDTLYKILDVIDYLNSNGNVANSVSISKLSNIESHKIIILLNKLHS